MLHYHEITGMSRNAQVDFLPGRHALVSHAYKGDIEVVTDFASSFILDNGAFTFFGQKKQQTWQDIENWFYDYMAWVVSLRRVSGFDWCVIPDVIGGGVRENRMLVNMWPTHIPSSPVWHMIDPLEYLEELVEKVASPTNQWPLLCISTANYADQKSRKWEQRIADAMSICCNAKGEPKVRLHGLGIMSVARFTKIPFRSGDSSNVVQNRNTVKRFGQYPAKREADRARHIANCIEPYNSPVLWDPNVFRQEEETLDLFDLLMAS